MRHCPKVLSNWPLLLLIGASFILTLAACWIVPYRMAFGPSGSKYTCFYLPDEATYATRLQPLHQRSNANNTLNGVTDPNAISPLFLERLIRGIVTLFDVDIIKVFWAWRVLFPMAFAIACIVLARSALPRRLPTWTLPLYLSAAAAAFVLLYLGDDLLMAGYPLRYSVSRIPTSIEVLFSLLLAWLFVRFLSDPKFSSGAPLVLGAVLLLYLRPYAAIPWGMMIAACMSMMVLRRTLTLRLALALLGVTILALLPLLLLARLNSSSSAYADMMQRTFYTPFPYSVHPRWLRFLIMAAGLWAFARFAEGRFRPFFHSAAIALAVLPFICGLFSFAAEMVTNDRFVGFYLSVGLAGGMLILARHSSNWKGRAGYRRARRFAFALQGVALLAAVWVARTSLVYEINSPRSPYEYCVEEQRFLPAYQWTRQNTPPGALFLVDDGIDWSQMPLDDRFLKLFYRRMLWNEDFFQVVARRRKVWSDKLQFDAISEQDLLSLYLLQQGTFGLAVPLERYRELFKRFDPSYILWHKNAPGNPPRPRGRSGDLKYAVVYSDAETEIWKIEGLK